LEKEAFRLKPGEISGIVQLSDKFVIIYLEGFTKPVQVGRDEVKSLIYEDVHEKKMRLKMTSEFDRLKDDARIDNYLAGTSQSPQRTAAKAGGRPNGGVSANVPTPAPRPNMDDGAVPASFETTGLIPRNAPSESPSSSSAVKAAYGSKSNADQPRNGSPVQR
jgi:hypothetical protein